MADLRWFAPDRFCALPVEPLRRAGLTIDLDGDAPSRAVLAADVQGAAPAFAFASRHRCPIGLIIADLPPWRLGTGRPDPVFALGGRLVPVPRLRHRYAERPRYYSRIRYVARRARRIWCPSAATTEDVRRRWGLDAMHLPFCYDSDRFHPAGVSPVFPRLPPSSPFTILSISRLVAHKNHAAILHAAARLDPRPRVRIIGQGPEAPALAELAGRLGVPLTLDAAWVSNEAIVDAYRHADVVVSASRFEGVGLTPLEAIAMGVPVVASDIPSHREFVGRAARLVDPDDPAALAEAIAAAAAAPRLDVKVREAVLAPLSIEACAARYLPELERLLDRAP